MSVELRKRDPGPEPIGVCSECVYADVQILDDETLVVACHRFPPQIVVLDEGLTQVWPQMGDGEWCGEFIPAPPALPDGQVLARTNEVAFDPPIERFL